jgi:hypothetical protein
VEPGATAFAPFSHFHSLSHVQGVDGIAVDATRVPFAKSIEELLQLHGTATISLANHEENYRAHLSWNREHFPSLLLWYSNRGRQGMFERNCDLSVLS